MRKVAAGTFSAALAWMPLQATADAPERLDAQSSATSALVSAVVERHDTTGAEVIRRPGRGRGREGATGANPAPSATGPPAFAGDTAVLDTSGERSSPASPTAPPTTAGTARTAPTPAARPVAPTAERSATVGAPTPPGAVTTPAVTTPSPVPASPPAAAPAGSLLDPPLYIERDTPAAPGRTSDGGIDLVWIALAGSAVALTAAAATSAARTARRRSQPHPGPEHTLLPDPDRDPDPDPRPEPAAPVPAAVATTARAVLDLQWVEPPPRLQASRLRVQFV